MVLLVLNTRTPLEIVPGPKDRISIRDARDLFSKYGSNTATTAEVPIKLEIEAKFVAGLFSLTLALIGAPDQRAPID